MAAANAATKATKVRPARAFFFPAPVSGSRIISSVPAIDRMISGRKRKYSSAETGSALADTGKLLGVGSRRHHLERHVHRGFLQDRRGHGADARQKRLRAHAQPDHQKEQRNGYAPFTRAEIGHVGLQLLGSLSVEHSLVEPKHVAG